MLAMASENRFSGTGWLRGVIKRAGKNAYKNRTKEFWSKCGKGLGYFAADNLPLRNKKRKPPGGSK